MSWAARILPFIEQQSLWQETLSAYSAEPFFEVDPPHVGLATVIPLFGCPADSRTSNPVTVGAVRVAFTSYLGVEGTNQSTHDGILYLDSQVRLADILDGTGNTLFVGERPPSKNGHYGWWYAGWGQDMDGSADTVLGVCEVKIDAPPPLDDHCPRGVYTFGPGSPSNQCDAYHYWSLHSGGANFLYADATVHFLPYEISSIMPALATRAGGETPTVPQ
jgi:prepilin-type processing-associated H-X9-DG protein